MPDTFELRRIPNFSPITPTPLPTAPADARVPGIITETLSNLLNQPFGSADPRIPRSIVERFRAGHQASQTAGRAALEAAQNDPSGAALVSLAVRSVRSHIDRAGVDNRLFGPALTAATREVLNSITPESVARDGLAQTFSNAVARIRSAAVSIYPAVADRLTPHPLELALRGS
ncbi:MAG: hypothetical protein Q8S33_02360 [Myxococcales bacterium]|nr:hypothetical protein [Myxococcales bacterium]